MRDQWRCKGQGSLEGGRGKEKVMVVVPEAPWLKCCGGGATATTSRPLSLAAPFQQAGSQLYSDRASFEAPLTVSLVDGYDNAAYFVGDNFNGANFDSFTDAAVSAIVGETQYETTGFNNNNLIPGQSSGDPLYCAGCNGSYRLSFRTTSVGTAEGVWAVGFDIVGTAEGVRGTVAFVTYGDGSTGEFVLPEHQDVFWGIIDCRRIASIHLGLSGEL
ncbi:unnamed protein product [Symbiodinium natans]|uniref:Uncharacterized protein n=1 Tax=Symbiodinium natans TaxID=878477 RepID=A0A812IDH8_9DINO|nr:unnamed protein product [Symbiodinium natans]